MGATFQALTLALIVPRQAAPGQEVKAGETLAIVEAMKMENVLRTERDGIIKALYAKKGDSLAVDAKFWVAGDKPGDLACAQKRCFHQFRTQRSRNAEKCHPSGQMRCGSLGRQCPKGPR
jgi:pyruvate/2-oxoglutarate dehydrogenase complex dihydrolipoamide acyltransferase (E2) component